MVADPLGKLGFRNGNCRPFFEFVKKSILPESIVVVSKDQISCDPVGEAAILELKRGTYFGLDEIGATVWNLIAQPRRVVEVRDALVNRFSAKVASRVLVAGVSSRCAGSRAENDLQVAPRSAPQTY
jgi:hypothetical protein